MKTICESVLSAGLSARGTLYAYDLERLRARCAGLTRMAIPRKRLFFASMSNDHPDILACIRACGLGVFVNSFAHLKLARHAGFTAAQTVYAAANMVPDEMEACYEQGVNLVLDSIGQIAMLGEVTGGAGARIGLRLNVGGTVGNGRMGASRAYRFGVTPDEIPAAIQTAKRAHIAIVGAHSYFGTGVLQPSLLIRGLKRLAAVAPALPELEYLDVAGGFGVPDRLGGEEFDLDEYSRLATEVMARLGRKLGRDLSLYIEPGRYVVADSGYYFTKVVDCKVRPDRVFVGTTGSVATFPRPLLYPREARHPCELLGSESRPLHPDPVFVCGNSTYSQDFLARGISLPLPHPGQTLAFHNAGAYGRSMISRFLGKEVPPEIVVHREQALRLAANT